MSELTKLTEQKTGGSRRASSASYLSALTEKKDGTKTLYADSVKNPSAASEKSAAGGSFLADAVQRTGTAQTGGLYSEALRNQSGTASNLGKATNAAKNGSTAMKTIYNASDGRESSLPTSEYAGILKAADYGEKSKSTGSKVRGLGGDARYDYINSIGNTRQTFDTQDAAGRGTGYSRYAYMTDDEIGVYNYLYATEGKKAANRFLQYLEPELDKQRYSGTSAVTTEALGKNDATRIAGSALTAIAMPARTLTSLVGLADDAITAAKGEEINPYSQWRQLSNITNDLRSDTAEHIEDSAKTELGGKAGSFAYQTVMSALDSLVGGFTGSGIAQGLGFTGNTLLKATNVITSGLMSSEVASQAIAEGKEKGYSNAGAAALGLTRGAVEYASEAIGGEWVIRNIKKNPLSFVKSMVLNMVPEGTEEVMSDAANGAVNLIVDALFGTEESGIPKTLVYYRQSGTDWQKKNPELATVISLLGQEGLSFLGGALATVASSGVQSYNMRIGIRATAQRLNTTQETVVQLMDEMKTDDPGTVYALAELTDAESADELRERAGDLSRLGAAASEAQSGDTSNLRQLIEQRKNGETAAAGTEARTAQEFIESTVKEKGGQTDAERSEYSEEPNVRESHYQGQEDGNTDLGAAEEAGESGRTGGNEALTGSGTEIQRGLGENAQADLRQVTPRELGITAGGTESVTLVDAEKLGGEAAGAYTAVREAGYEPVAIRGELHIRNGIANAYVENGRIYFRTDARDASGRAISPRRLVEHEIFHMRATEQVLLMADSIIRERMTSEEYDAMREVYKSAYASIYDYESMSVEEIEALITEEVAADAYAGINYFAENGETESAVREATEKSAPAQSTETQETRGPPEGRAQTFVGYDEETGHGIYRSNFEENTPKSKKAERVIQLIQDVWSKKPIDLVVENDDGTRSIIKAEFDPNFDETDGKQSDASKLAGGNRHGTARDKRVTLNLADDFYQIIQESVYNGKKAETGKTSDTHSGVSMWRYFVNPILYMEYSGNVKIPYTVSIDVKQKNDRNFVYSFHAEQDNKNNGQPAPQTLHAAVSDADNGITNGLPTNSIRSKTEKSQAKSSGRASVDVSFGRNVDEWLKSTLEDKRSTSPGYFRIGTTSEALQSIGARTDNIYMRKSKIGTIFEDHPEMDADIIKKIPDILENPILIAKSLTRSDSIVLLSEEKTNNGENLMVALELTPKPGGSTEAEFSLVTSAYGRGDGNLQNLINNSELLYLDTNKKRADTWLMQLRVQFPSRQPPYGSIGTIAYTESGVKITGKKLNELGGTIRKIRSGRASTDISRINSRTKKELLEEYERRSGDYDSATARNDPDYPYEEEFSWIKAAMNRLAEIFDEKRAKRTVAGTKRDIMRLFSTDKANRADVERLLNRKIGEMMAEGRITDEALNETVDELLQAGSVLSDSKNSPWIDETYESIRADMKGTRLYVSEKTWKDFSSDEKKELRGRARRAGIALTRDSADVPPDVRNMELADKYGEELFPTDIAASDMLRNIIDCAERGESRQQTLDERLWDEAGMYGAGSDRESVYEESVGELRNQAELILREFAEDNNLTLQEEESGTEATAQPDTEEKAQPDTEKPKSNLPDERGNPGEGRRFLPDKGAGETYRELLENGKAEVKVQATAFAKGTPAYTTFKIELETDAFGQCRATVWRNGKSQVTFAEPTKEYAARDAAEYVDIEANRSLSKENAERAKRYEAERAADEDARIAELFAGVEEIPLPDSGESTAEAGKESGENLSADEAGKAKETNAAARVKVTTDVETTEKTLREQVEAVSGGAMRMFVNAGDTIRRIAKRTGNKSLEGYYFNAGAYSQRAGNWIAAGGARTDIDGKKIGASLTDTLAEMRKDKKTYREFQLYLLHMHNVDRMKYDNTAELEQIRSDLRWIKGKYPQLQELSGEELRRIADEQGDGTGILREEANAIFTELHEGKDPRISSVAEAAQLVQHLQRKMSRVRKQGLKPVFGYDITADDSRTAAQLLETEHPEFKEWAKKVYAYSNDLLAYRVRAGLMTSEEVRALQKRYPHYVPTMRVEGTTSREARRVKRNGGITISSAVGRAEGGDAVILPLHTTLARKTVSVMRNAGRNMLGGALLSEYENHPDAVRRYMPEVSESEYNATEADTESDDLFEPLNDNIMTVIRDGKRYDITMDEGLTTAMNAFKTDKYANLAVARALKKGNDLFKNLCTGYNPFFMVRNLFRDAQDAGLYSSDSKTWAVMFPQAWRQIIGNGEIWQQYKALGGSYASILDYNTGEIRQAKNAAARAAAKYEALGQAIEAAPRLAEFMTILANKAESRTAKSVETGTFSQSDLMEAMLGAADITTNFARGGTVTKALNRYVVPFLNPSVQGFDKFVRTITDTRSVKAAGSLILKAALLGIVPTILNGLMYRDDDEWEDIPDQTKANYYLIKGTDGIWIKIPKGRAVAVLSAGAVYAQEAVRGDEPKASDVFEVVKSNIAPTDIFNQNIMTAWTQTKLFNPDNPGTTWYGGNIESDRLQNYRPGERYDEKTDELSKAIGKAFNLSPKKINYLLDQYSGVVGDLLLPYLTPAATASSPALAPAKSAFTIDVTSTNETTSAYYDLLDELKYDANDGDLSAEIARKYVSHAGDAVNDYYQQIRAMQNDSTLTKGEKNRLVRALKRELIEKQKEIISNADAYREAAEEYLSEHPELATDNGAAVSEYAEANGISEEQAESRMDAIVYRETNRGIFGAEYALETYSSPVYDKAAAAAESGVSFESYYDFYFATKDMYADKDANGKSISGTKKAKVVAYINSMDISAEEKDALYVAAGYTASSAKNQVWNGGSGKSSGGGRRGGSKKRTVKAPDAPTAAKSVIPKASVSSGSTAGRTKSSTAIADIAASGIQIREKAEKTVKNAVKSANTEISIAEGSPLDYFLKYGRLPKTR